MMNYSILATTIFALHGCSVHCANVEGKTALRLSRNLQLKTVTKLELVNAQTDKKIVDLFDGQIIYMQEITGLITPNFNINASTSGPVSSRSLVVVWFEGPPEGQAGVSIVASHLGMRHNQCLLFQNYIKYFLDALIQKMSF